MKHQKVSVDVWSMVKTMVGYLAVVVLGGVLLRLMIAVVMLPRRFARERENVDRAIKNLQERYPECFKDAAEGIESEKNKNEGRETEEDEQEELEEAEQIEQVEIKGDLEKKAD